MTDHLQLQQLVAACHWIGAKGWAPATGGNMSVRQDADWCWLSESGKDKGSLTTADFLQVSIADNHAPSGRKPSAETGLHTLIYRLYPQANAVLHVHTVNATVLSRVEKSSALLLNGFEMQKSLSGQTTHLDTVPVAIFDNDQDIDALAARIADYAQTHPLRYGFLLRGHGLTCWGRDVAEARRHLEGLEFLFECEMQRRLLEKP
ncbi:methylthioribulose 1-phosphate dehydratase [Kosakonia radicincitans]|uniref:Methylthioribulose-1-phosphate dehydratase n=1 Tax=Kosakonia radicincitans TaxID=283686 RepID=A0AAX2EMF4_9ENTR|nr:methylthioribulose 1-phosphate dehydratase [Kosakonia radicincitans]MDP9564814.1 methylthioribulose-1-phosphate dehydratase [Kosakonia oryzae]MDD7995696.1 methylthioribulose 1-phosphate dehydratase [Kosakonia radicincitans]QEM92552.1 methylthioribulose 1-phosphate dehydratase [Kosakonia radicincitans]SET08284.1 methylthioribulose-1-phosphate dehydratase [Kosakonia radicincitans]SFD95527.1 methylthioribulose-1-phosphate dehydratase [Kosakonia radicincitans]